MDSVSRTKRIHFLERRMVEQKRIHFLSETVPYGSNKNALIFWGKTLTICGAKTVSNGRTKTDSFFKGKSSKWYSKNELILWAKTFTICRAKTDSFSRAKTVSNGRSKKDSFLEQKRSKWYSKNEFILWGMNTLTICSAKTDSQVQTPDQPNISHCVAPPFFADFQPCKKTTFPMEICEVVKGNANLLKISTRQEEETIQKKTHSEFFKASSSSDRMLFLQSTVCSCHLKDHKIYTNIALNSIVIS